ncbi:tail protein X [Moraxella haemolytica]|uniref:tail protein X n=1 Tax=Moraxella TaxID=475 RepID=UPI002542B8F0|nr:tail protein X [Moraxella sp. ZY171148]WII94716.1 tail protein X [Moraxella sp. ZY171148]
MNRIIYSIQNDSIDAISHRYYGKSVVEQILAVNPHLAKEDVILPIGTKVILPSLITTNPVKQTIQLWS